MFLRNIRLQVRIIQSFMKFRKYNFFYQKWNSYVQQVIPTMGAKSNNHMNKIQSNWNIFT